VNQRHDLNLPEVRIEKNIGKNRPSMALQEISANKHRPVLGVQVLGRVEVNAMYIPPDLKTLKGKVYRYLEEHPTATIKDLYFKFPDATQNTLRKYRRAYQGEFGEYYRREIGRLLYIMFHKMEYTEDLSPEEKRTIDRLWKFVRR
jgi:hypothetical protein